MIYFDNSATTIPYPEVLRTYQEVASKIYGNPSSLHNLGTKASRILEASRKQIADLLGVKAQRLFSLLAVQKVTTGFLKVLLLKKNVMENTLLSLILNTLLLKSLQNG